MKKRGLSHIEVILASILFIGFIFASLYLFEPTTNTQLTQSASSYALREIIENTTTEIDSYAFVLDNNAINGNTVAIEINGVDYYKKSQVYDIDGKLLQSDKAQNLGSDTAIVYVRHEDNDYITIRFSRDFSVEYNGVGQVPVNKDYYKNASYSNDHVMSEKLFRNLEQDYKSNYDGVRDNFNLPVQTDFGFKMIFDDGTFIEASNRIPAGTEVYTLQRRREILRTDDSFVFGNLIVSTW